MLSFVRHGQTELNRGGRLQGRIDAPLSSLGITQAEALGHGFASQPVTRVLTSPLRRARDTAEQIARHHGLAVEVDPRVIELDYGAWDGRALAEVSADDWARWRNDPEFAPPDGERLSDVAARVASFCADVLRDDLVVAVSHVSPIKAAVCAALQVDDRVTWRMHLDVASVTRIGRRPDGVAYLEGYNDASLVKSSGG